ncbi:TonB-dependent receptor plug domain-containing protein [Methylobacter sp. YRD-M1]|uniref:TonB-dependent receptor plug domain-containing protein n=1 Tax=Methylobacter sp. YRD-M1 TaxID=2911520 RepID=UPI00227C9AA5|nr:TonB-dependent receptor plug domain-containing protein [Methylobacter sp. YRD-M1]WAK02893.1 TonB-dependent receptor plug domain-containing protein [Methylobacter sp. YRD-M1]
MKDKAKKYLAGGLFALFSLHEGALASEHLSCDTITETDIVDLDLSELGKVPVFLSANQKATCTRQAAGIVTVISGQEIRNMGARDLIDVLQLVPGFSFGVDTSNVVGLGIRGIQAHEGKVALFIDGINLNEHRFGTTQFGNHFPVEQIDRIEIIRGPGSIIHGNFAEMGVINIISKNASQIDGVKVSGAYGRFERGEARKNMELVAGKKWGDWEVTLSGKNGEAHRSDRIYRDALGQSFDMSDSNELESRMINFDIKYKDIDFRMLVDDYSVDSRDGFAATTTGPERYLNNRFTTYAGNLNYQYDFTEAIQLDLNAQFSRQNPWERNRKYFSGEEPLLRERVFVDFYKFDAKTTFASDKGDYLVLGSSFSFDKFDIRMPEEGSLDTPVPTFSDYTAYAEGSYAFPWVTALAGLRFDAYNEYGTNLAPRVALTKDFGRFHFKALYSQAFRIPTGGNYQKNEEYNAKQLTEGTEEKQVGQVRPEKTHTAEIEFGYELLDNLDLTVNLFDIQSKNIILYAVDEKNDDFYINAAGQSTRGIETGLRYNAKDWGYLELDYSFYQATRNTADKYKIITAKNQQIHDRLNVGFPTHKVTLNAHANITPSFSINPTLIFVSDRYGYTGDLLTQHKPAWMANVYFRYQNLLTKGLEVGLGFYDIFNERFEYVQPYNGGHPALPGPSREIMLKLSYQY